MKIEGVGEPGNGHALHCAQYHSCAALWIMINFAKRSQSLQSRPVERNSLRHKVTAQNGNHGKHYQQRSMNQRLLHLTNCLYVMFLRSIRQRESGTVHNGVRGPIYTRLFNFSHVILAREKIKRKEEGEPGNEAKFL